jgi:TonB-linked SusC/RagA family outer membrane protein
MQTKVHELMRGPALLFIMILFAGLAGAQTVRISGKVSDKENQPIPGVNIIIDGTTTGVTSNYDGSYAIECDTKATLIYSYIGMIKQKIAVEGKTIINVTLLDDVQNLKEVVVIGYGTKLKGEVTGAIAQTDSKVFERRPIVNTLDALQGVLPGVTVTRSSGRAGGEGHSLQIRGSSSINGNKPLVLVDGVPGNLDVLNPNDIKNITVLKDAAASIYGARAADGVLIVTTKSGSKGSPKMTYSYSYGIKTPTFLKKMTNTMRMAEMYDEGLRNIGQPGLSEEVFEKIRNNAEPDPNGGWMKYLENYPGFYQSQDWNDVVFGPGEQQMHNLSFAGGNDVSNYHISAAYEKNSGILKFGEEKSERYNLRLNYDFKMKNIIKFETRTTFDNLSSTEPSYLNEALRVVSRNWSYLPVYNPQGQFYKYQGYGNPASDLVEGGVAESSYSRFSTNVKATADIFEGLKLVGQAGVAYGFWHGNSTYPTFNAYNWDGGIQTVNNNPNSATYANSNDISKTLLTYLDYSRKIFVDHNINLMAGTSFESYDHQYQSTSGYNFVNNSLFTLNLSDKTNLDYTKNFTGTATSNALLSYFGRFSYAYKGKAFLDFTTRIDGSSKFAPTKRWSAVFPAVSASYNLAQESFLNPSKFFDNLKIRASWGQTGNQDLSFGNFDYIPLLYLYGNYPLGSPNVGLQGAESSLASASRSWETIESLNFGLDFSILDTRLSGSADYFIKDNKNMLVGIQLPAVLGGTPPTFNAGELRTKGWEAMLTWADQIGELTYSISASMSDSKNELVSLEGSDAYYEGMVYAREGYSLNSYFGYQFDGIIKSDEQLEEYKKLEGVPSNLGIGDVMYKDVDGDGKITAYGDPDAGYKGDLVYLGNKLPRYTYSANLNLSFKNFDLNIFLQGVGQRDGVKWSDFGQPFYWVWHQPLDYFYEKNYTPENPDAEYPRIIPGGIGYDNLRDWNWRTSAMRVDQMGYIRLKNITLAYNIPATIVSRTGLESARVFVSGKDLFTFCKGSWENSFDPEEGRDDEQTYPFSKIISFGIEVKL